MTDNNKFVPQTPKTYEVRYVDLTAKESKITKLASYLGLSQASCSGKEVSKKADEELTTREQSDAALKKTEEQGGTYKYKKTKSKTVKPDKTVKEKESESVSWKSKK